MTAGPDIQIVLNLTTPQTHYPIAKEALEAGKHVYTEKPLAVSRQEGRKLVELAAAKGLLTKGSARK